MKKMKKVNLKNLKRMISKTKMENLNHYIQVSQVCQNKIKL